jgi:hypothetical protein
LSGGIKREKGERREYWGMKRLKIGIHRCMYVNICIYIYENHQTLFEMGGA